MTHEATGMNMAPISQGQMLFDEGDRAWRHGDFETATLRLEESLQLFQDIGENIGMLRAQHLLANVAYSQSDFALARSRHGQVLHWCREQGLAEGVASSLNNLGLVAMQQHDYQAGQELMEESLRIYRELAMEQSITAVLHNLGGLALHKGDVISAYIWFVQSLRRSHDASDTTFTARNIAAMARIASRRGEHTWAAQLWGMAEALNEQPGTAMPNPDQSGDAHETESTRQVLGETVFAAAWTEGRGMPVEHVLENVIQPTS